jgi:hypothetical protein
MALQIGAVVTAIAGLSVSGVTIADDNLIPPNMVDPGRCVLYPEPAGFITDFSLTHESFGQHNVAKMTAHYTLNYTYCHCPIGQGNALETYSDVVTKFGLIADAIMTNTLTTVVNIEIGTADVGPVQDPAGNYFLGAHFTVLVSEFVN